MQDMAPGHLEISHVLPHNLHCGLLEDQVDLFQCPVFRFWHEQSLIEPANYSNATVEAKSEADVGKRVLHASEIVGDDEAGKEEPAVGGGHAVRTEISGIHFSWDDPSLL